MDQRSGTPNAWEVETNVEFLQVHVLRFLSKEDGQGLVEYALIIALIAIAVIAVFPGLSSALKNVFTNITNEVGGGGS
ncbi:MAG TPA: Flp family type IVb pilin [Firmicutes bacterium]|nr:Flp family type IVb pilin [Candidatus Fermentithermobacillaceae bacterium]